MACNIAGSGNMQRKLGRANWEARRYVYQHANAFWIASAHRKSKIGGHEQGTTPIAVTSLSSLHAMQSLAELQST